MNSNALHERIERTGRQLCCGCHRVFIRSSLYLVEWEDGKTGFPFTRFFCKKCFDDWLKLVRIRRQDYTKIQIEHPQIATLRTLFGIFKEELDEKS